MRNTDMGAYVAERLRHFRAKSGLSVRALAKKAEVGAEMISRAERNAKTPTVQTLDKLCRGLGISLGEFFEGASERVATADTVNLDGLDEQVRQVVLEGFRAMAKGLRAAEQKRVRRNRVPQGRKPASSEQ